MLYMRMIVNMAISLYTSRVVLQTLGVEDYGVYGVVCGVLTMFSFLNSSMSGATSRFLTYELGKNDSKRLSDTFSTSLFIHFIIALIIAVLCESVGIWFINNKLVIPTDRLVAAHWVFQFAVLSMFVCVTQVPYNSIIFSHERMDIYAYVEIVNSLLKLLIVYLLLIGNMDKMILYAILNFCVTLFIALYYRYYCVSHFDESKFHWVWNKDLLKDMLSLSRPQIVKSYAISNHEETLDLMRDGARLTFVLMMFFSIPLMIESHYILELWLGKIPPNTEIICILTLLWNIVVSMNITISYAVQATGCVKRISLVSGTLFLLVIPISYICFLNGMSYTIPFIYNIIAVIIAPFIGGGPTLQKKIKGYSLIKILLIDNVRDWSAMIITGITVYKIHLFFDESLFRFILTTTTSSILIAFTAYFIVFPSDRRNLLTKKIKEKIWKRPL